MSRSSRGGQGSVQGVNTRVYNISGTTFKVDRRYRELKGIGRGSYGVPMWPTNMTEMIAWWVV